MEGCCIRTSFPQELRFVLVLSVFRSGVKAVGVREEGEEKAEL